ncbi:tyrosine-type recombinase/integrase [Blastococcus mobilis]|uniref:Phage integrase family protein n=1 Tax=Blastococcus mobilis TaxID=1938746 RepID=A0A238VXV1_9ACTN|nr:tyrosine-type recombinase/integrase [Blastococcus mobilis]SNR39068.1 Phage integrase family protein [Blastococcus mobilis]
MTAHAPTAPADEWVSSVHVYVWPRPQPRSSGNYVVKWRVGTAQRSRSKPAAPGRKPDAIAEAFRAELVRAAGNPTVRFHRVSGLPEGLHLAEQPAAAPVAVPDVLQLAVAVIAREWGDWSPGNRKSRVETMACIVAALLTDDLPRGITLADARRALYAFLLPPEAGRTADLSTQPQAVRAAVAWIPDHVRPATDLTLPVVEEALVAASTQLNGKLYEKDRRTATRGSFNWIGTEAVRLGLLPVNPVRDAKRVRPVTTMAADTTATETEEDVDSTVVDPDRVMDADECRAFCVAVREHSWYAWRFAVFFTLLWTTGMRPSEALSIRNAHKRLHLPDDGSWGWVRLWRPTVDAGDKRWTGTGGKHADRAHLKARAVGAERHVPLPPETVRALRELIDRTDVRPGARLFLNTQGNLFSLDHLGRVFRTVRRKLHPDGPLSGVTMYQLRHSMVTTAIAQGVPLPKIAEVVGNSPATIMKTYSRVLTTDDEKFIEQMGAVFG